MSQNKQNLNQRQITKKNTEEEILTARVVANYGDPGITEDKHFDILSRFVIVMLESCDRIPTSTQYRSMFGVVLRPQHLWINVDGGVSGSQANQRRSDAVGNINIGSIQNYSLSNIPKINKPYQIGETLKIKKFKTPIPVSDAIFKSEFGNSTLTGADYDMNAAYIATDPTPDTACSTGFQIYGTNPPQNARFTEAKKKCLASPNTANNYNNLFSGYMPSFPIGVTKVAGTIDGNTYWFLLNRYAFALFWRYIHSSEICKYDKILLNTFNFAGATNIKNNPYVFRVFQNIFFTNVAYEDINEDNKVREINNECQPLIVTTPNSFPTPQVRQAGTIIYNPTYSPIIVS
jgi:hypothetical protein